MWGFSVQECCCLPGDCVVLRYWFRCLGCLCAVVMFTWVLGCLGGKDDCLRYLIVLCFTLVGLV